eukprot:TRINITY_DN7867_c0_g2_i1.p1 TRINITY_DN7867_c0_g2~~TRINITY_DN7867_c0_g2_i1.p1  ORF type:complete len:303 (-),score=39.45 TRINITY_DN7867_c0_g2_i1:2136-2912(-)
MLYFSFILCCIFSCQFLFVAGAPTLCAYYKTNGLGQLATNEGGKVLAPNGQNFIIVDSAQKCVTACEVMIAKCGSECCDSVTYNPTKQECWLKVGGSRYGSSVNSDGWQTYWRVGSGSFNGNSASQLMAVAGGAAACSKDLQADEDSSAYVTKGPGELAVNEGAKINTATGRPFATVQTVDECALQCEAVKECDSFTVSLNYKKCYLKSGAAYETRVSSQGWTSYWKVPYYTASSNCKQEDWYCMYCGGFYGNSCRTY